jgi:hypothetical protein
VENTIFQRQQAPKTSIFIERCHKIATHRLIFKPLKVLAFARHSDRFAVKKITKKEKNDLSQFTFLNSENVD